MPNGWQISAALNLLNNGLLNKGFSTFIIWVVAITLFVGGGGLNAIYAANPLPEKLVGHGGPIRAIELSKDGRYALTGSFDYAINLWDLSDGKAKIIHRLIGHDAAVNDVAFVGDNQAVSVGDDGAFILWDLMKAAPIKKFAKLNDKILDVAVSKDQQWAATARWDGLVHLYNLKNQTLAQAFKGHRGNVNGVEFSHDSKWLYSASYDGSIRQWSVADDSEPRILVKHGWGINVIKLINDHELIYGALDGLLMRIDVDAKHPSKEILKSNRPILSIAVSRDGSFYASGGGDGFIHVFARENDKELEQYQASFGPVWAMAFTHDMNAIYHAGLDDFASLWQLNPRKAYEPVTSKLPRRFQVSSDTGHKIGEGELQFKRKCSVCHTLQEGDGNRAGPSLYKLFGRQAGTVPDYPYSQALLDSNIIWNAKTLSQLFDEDPDVVTPGTKMPIQRLKSVEKRDELIDYLKQATAPKDN